MNRILDKNLCKRYPEIFRDRHGDICQTLMPFGFECDDGWYDIINNLCKKIMDLKPNPVPVATQVKEKYGTLRFYVNSAGGEIHKLILDAETKSSWTCEVCGELGRRCSTGTWCKTLCPTHRIKLGYSVW